jgi:hypothetical protein
LNGAKIYNIGSNSLSIAAIAPSPLTAWYAYKTDSLNYRRLFVPEKRLPSYRTTETPVSHQTDLVETDDEFLNRQFQSSIQALERVHALSPGEFDRLVHTPVRTEEERRLRSTHHEDIARRALIAAQHGLLSEEEFNIWSGRRKEAGQPVKYRFERAYANMGTPLLSCKRGALTGIVRSYVRLQDELIAALIAEGESLTSADDLLALEQQAV